jgi:hypothetical protein
MKDICIQQNGVAGNDRDLKYSLIWAALWVVSLMALLGLPALGR